MDDEKVVFTWRKTMWKNSELYTLIGWEGVLKKLDLPFEYLNYRTAAFWTTGSEIRCVDLHNIMTPPTLRVGSVMKEVDYVIFKAYVTAACKHLRDVRMKLAEAEEVKFEA